MSCNYNIAKNVLNETEKNRLICLFLSTDTPNIDWEKATQQFGAASVASMRVSLRNIVKKIKAAEDEAAASAPTPGDGNAQTSAAADSNDDDDDNDDDENKVIQTPKTKRRHKAKPIPRADRDDNEEGGEEAA